MTFDDLKKLHQKKFRDEFGFFLAEGEHLILELGKAIAHRPELAATRILVSHEYRERGLPEGFPLQLPIEVLNARQMSQLSETRSPQGVIAVVPHLRPLPASAGERGIYLHQIQDPGNLGTILRSLAWFGGFRCLLSPGSVDPYNGKVVRGSMGAIFRVPLEIDIDISTLQDRYQRFALLDMRGKSVTSEAFKQSDCYLFGSESQGSSPEMSSLANDAVFAIPGGDGIESLNLAMTVNLCIYEVTRSGR